jgi:sulfite exporter TauE/SafE
MGAIELGAAFAMGAMGSGHCVAMCGGLAGVLTAAPERRARLPMLRQRSPTHRRALTALATHGGRLFTYGALGALGGAIGAAVRVALPLGSIQIAARVVAAVTLVAVALHLSGVLRVLSPLEHAGGSVGRLVRRLLGASMSDGVVAAWVRGAVWGLVPCGLVYGAVALALASGSVKGGIEILIMFGAGTMPALLLVGGLADAVRTWARHPRIRMTLGALVGVSALMQIALIGLDAGIVAWPSGSGERPCCAAREAREAIEKASVGTP